MPLGAAGLDGRRAPWANRGMRAQRDDNARRPEAARRAPCCTAALLLSVATAAACEDWSASASRRPAPGAGSIVEPPADSGDSGFAPDAGPAATADAGPQTPADAGPADAGPGSARDAGTGSGPDAGTADAGTQCPPPPAFDYACTPGDVTTCPQGLCMPLVNQCIAPVVDAHRWDACGDGACGPCETAQACPADCGAPPATGGAKEYANATTITVWVHGFSNQGPDRLAQMTYGEAKSCSSLGTALHTFGIARPCGTTPGAENAPNQVVGVEYYGTHPAAWMTPAEIAEVEAYPFSGGPMGLQRYATVVAKFIRHKLATTGATHVNLACHSMGCLISRQLLENDYEHLASENRVVRWVTSAGVIAGARLARMFDNPSVQQMSRLIGLEVSDFILMNPDYVRDHAAAWDHRPWEGNNPLLGGILIHHVGGTDPRIPQAMNAVLLDLNNPGDEPNDGIMYTHDEAFERQSPAASVHTPSGAVMSATLTLSHTGHMEIADSDAYQIAAAAGLFHRRKATITVQSITLRKDRESHQFLDGEQGTGPAEVVAETEVRFDPYVAGILGRAALVHEDRIEYRSPAVLRQQQGTTLTPGTVLFAGPVFDAMTELHLRADLVESDLFRRWGVQEALLDPTHRLLLVDRQVPLQDHVFTAESEYAAVSIAVRVVDMY